MNIAILSWAGSEFRGGVEKFNASLTGALKSGGHSVELFAFSSLKDSFSKNAFTKITEKTPYNGYWKAWLLAKAFEKQQHRFDLVIANDFFGLYVNKIKQIAVMHGMFSDVFDCMRHKISPLYWLWGQELSRVQRDAFCHANLVVTPCQRNFEYAKRHGVTVHRVIPHGIDTDFWKPVENARIGIPEYRLPEHFLLSVGLKAPWKNSEMVERAAKDYSVVTVSGKKDAPRIVSLNNVAEGKMPAIYSSADLLFHPSLHEGFGYVTAEAMACETPVVCAKTGFGPELQQEMPELVVNHPLDYSEFREKIDAVLADQKSYGKKCRRFVEKNFGFKEWAKKWLELVESV